MLILSILFGRVNGRHARRARALAGARPDPAPPLAAAEPCAADVERCCTGPIRTIADGSVSPGRSPTTCGGLRGFGLPEASRTAFGSRHHGVSGNLAGCSLAPKDWAAATNMYAIGRNSLSNEKSYGTGLSLAAPPKTTETVKDKPYEMFDEFNHTDDSALVPSGIGMSLMSGHDLNGFAVQLFEATDQSDDSGRLLRGGEVCITAKAHASAIIFPEPEVSQCTARRPI